MNREGVIDWEKTVFVLFTPDTIYRNLVVPILDYMKEHHFTPVHFEYVWATSTDLDKLYALHIDAKWDTYRYRLVDQLFSFGPSLALLVEDTSGSAEMSSHQRMKKLKGYSHPYQAEEGTIRKEFGGINSILGLLHTSDDPDESLRESEIFLKNQHNPSFVQGIDTLFNHGAAEHRTFEDVLSGLRAKIITRVWNGLSSEEQEYISDYLAEGTSTWKQKFVSASFQDDLCTKLKIDPDLMSILAFNFDSLHPAYEFERIKNILRFYGVVIDQWEALVLNTSMYFYPTKSIHTLVKTK